MTLALVLAAAVVVSFAGTAFARRYALKRQLIDNPNQRSSHAMPTPRGGGLAIVFSFVGGTAALWALGVLDEPAMPIFLISALSVAAIGFWDDHGHISARWRLLVHFIAAGALVAVVGQARSITIASLTFNLGTPGLVIVVILVVWVLNLYNFMDEIDGIAAAEAITAAGGAAVILLIGGHEQLAGWLWLLAASCLGFAFWNKPPARIFMGDVGSGFLGFVLAGLAVITCVSGAMSVWSWGLLLGVFVVDATVTLLRRMLRGERLSEAHRSHAYQILSRRFGAHAPVTLGVTMINIVWLTPLAALSAVYPAWGWLCFVVGWVPLVVLVLSVEGAGRRQVQAGP